MNVFVFAWMCVYSHSNIRLWDSLGPVVLSRWLLCVFVCVWWYFDMGLAHCARVSKAPQAQRFLAHLYDPIMTGKLDTGEYIPLTGSLGRGTRLHKHTAPAIPVTGSGGVTSAQTHRFSHTPALQHRNSWTAYTPCSFLLKYAELHTVVVVVHTLTHTQTYICIHLCTHPHPRTALMKTPIAERTVIWLARRKHYTSTFRHMACGPTDGHTHMVLVASAASHGRKAQCFPLIPLQITVHSTQSTA